MSDRYGNQVVTVLAADVEDVLLLVADAIEDFTPEEHRALDRLNEALAGANL